MDSQRIQEIVDSPVMVNVSYHGIPVYIQEVYPDKETAKIFPLDAMNHEQEVDIKGLLEEGPKVID
ncbi:H-type small acid-soluble spore protein [Evansella tamaricis]|uniref:Small, acid-soluble spore protein H n=1 Tax=Evansella tamaricis TaxID=2069301 RepID=A0ABS6JK35_9BACI|nr:H-type small acid-soluble spore protein [Evansella tamaricis]MBU9714021.1 H-type small acid-soluble spore protein [Evansella tamaricis]